MLAKKYKTTSMTIKSSPETSSSKKMIKGAAPINKIKSGINADQIAKSIKEKMSGPKTRVNLKDRKGLVITTGTKPPTNSNTKIEGVYINNKLRTIKSRG